MQVVRRPEAIHELYGWACEHAEQQTTEHGEGNYGEGVRDALRWLFGDTRPDQ